MYFVLPESVFILLTINFCAFCTFCSYVTFLLLVFHNFLEPNRHFTFKVVSVFGWFYWLHLMMNCKAELYSPVLNMSELQKKIYISLNAVFCLKVGTQQKSFFLFHLFL